MMMQGDDYMQYLNQEKITKSCRRGWWMIIIGAIGLFVEVGGTFSMMADVGMAAFSDASNALASVGVLILIFLMTLPFYLLFVNGIRRQVMS